MTLDGEAKSPVGSCHPSHQDPWRQAIRGPVHTPLEEGRRWGSCSGILLPPFTTSRQEGQPALANMYGSHRLARFLWLQLN